MGLRNALWGYWSACEASTPIDLAIFRAAVEALKKGWFASTGEKSKGTYMPKEDFDKPTGDVLATVQERTATHPEAKAILNNLRRVLEVEPGEPEPSRGMRRQVVLLSNDGAVGSGEDEIVVDEISERGDVVGQHRQPQALRRRGLLAPAASRPRDFSRSRSWFTSNRHDSRFANEELRKEPG